MRSRTDRDTDVVVRWDDRCQRQVLEVRQPVGGSLPAGRLHVVDAGDLDTRDAQLVDGRLSDGPLAERRQHVGDVVEECLVRADDEYAVASEPGPMFEQEEGRSVERHRGLPGARASLHDEDLIDRRADDDVLFGLDRRDDLAHLARAFGTDLGEHGVGDTARDLTLVRIVEVLVEVCDQVAVVEREPSPERNAERVDRRRAVEGRGDRGPPVDDDRIVLVVLDVTAPDVPLVDAPEEVACSGSAEILERVGDGDLDVLLGDLVGSALGVDGLEPLDHAISRPSREGQTVPLGDEVGKQFGRHRGRTRYTGANRRRWAVFPADRAMIVHSCCCWCRSRTSSARSPRRS